MKSNLAYNSDMMDEDKTIGSLVSDQACLCVAEDCPIETLFAMMSNMATNFAAVVGQSGIFQGIVSRSALLGNLASHDDMNAETAVRKLSAGDVMIGTQSFLPSELGLNDALTIMKKHGFKTMPVLGDGAKLMGIATVVELTKAIENDRIEGFMGFITKPSHRIAMMTRH